MPAEYVVIDDNNRGDLDVEPAEITFFVSGPSGSGSLEDSASTDDCDCHVVYRGPQVVVLAPGID